MIRYLCLSALCLYSCLSSAEEINEETALDYKISKWRDAAEKGLDNVKQASGADKRYLIARYRFVNNSHYASEFYCDTSFYLTGHKFVDGTACQVSYKFVAKNEYNELQLQGNFLESQQAETCEEAEKICKQTKISFEEKENQLEILNHNKLIARIIYNNGLPGFLSE